MNQQNIAVIGGCSTDFLEYVTANKIDYTIFLDKRREQIDGNVVTANFSDVSLLTDSIKSTNTPFTGILTFYEEYIVDTARIAKELGLLGLSPESAIACTDKSIMRSKFTSYNPKITPQFKLITTLVEAEEFVHTYGFPVIIKPASLAKSLLVLKASNINELQDTFSQISSNIAEVYKIYAPRNEPKIVIEQFIEGSIHSIDAFVDKNGEPHLLEDIVDYKTGYDIGYGDNFHFSRTIPSKLTLDEKIQLKKCAVDGVRALQMTSSPAHIEIIMSKEGPKIVEIGARNGGYRQKMHLATNGINLYENHLRLLDDAKLDITNKKSESCVVAELFPRHKGTYKEIKNIDDLQKLSSLTYLNIRSEVGQKIGLSSDGFKAVAVVMLHHQDAKIVQKDIDFIINRVEILTN